MVLEFNHNEVLYALKALSLNSVSLGDYIVVMNGAVDITVRGEPYLALQLWLNMKSGDYMGRVWSQTTSYGRVASVTQFMEACTNHFRGRPCLGYPLDEDDKHKMMMSRDLNMLLHRECGQFFCPYSPTFSGYEDGTLMTR